MTKIVSWNVAGIRARMPALEKFLKEFDPDIVLLQEIKVTDETFPWMDLKLLGYDSYISGQKGFNGVAVLSRKTMDVVHDTLPESDLEKQARFIETKMGNTHYICVYVPNGNAPEKDPTDTSRLAYKLTWMAELTKRISTLIAEGKSVVLGGDFNVIAKDTDVYNPDGYRHNALMVPPVRAAFEKLSALAIINTIRAKDDSPHLYSFWDFQMGAWHKNWGMLLDTIFISSNMEKTLKASGVYKEVRGWEKTSDHAPVWCELE